MAMVEGAPPEHVSMRYAACTSLCKVPSLQLSMLYNRVQANQTRKHVSPCAITMGTALRNRVPAGPGSGYHTPI